MEPSGGRRDSSLLTEIPLSWQRRFGRPQRAGHQRRRRNHAQQSATTLRPGSPSSHQRDRHSDWCRREGIRAAPGDQKAICPLHGYAYLVKAPLDSRFDFERKDTVVWWIDEAPNKGQKHRLVNREECAGGCTVHFLVCGGSPPNERT